MNVLDVAIDILATKRVVRLVVEDEVTRPLREMLSSKDPRLAYLVGCKACSSVWAGLINVYLMPRSVKIALAISEGAILADLATHHLEEM